MSTIRSLPTRTTVAALLALTDTLSVPITPRRASAVGVPLVSISVSPSRRAVGVRGTVAYDATGHIRRRDIDRRIGVIAERPAAR